MVFNDFLPATGSAKIAVRIDGGSPEGGLDTASGEAAPGGATDESQVRLLEPGAEPRTVRKYAFAMGRLERRVLIVRQSMSQQGQEQEQPALSFAVEFAVKELKSGVATVEMKVVKVELADKSKLDPRLAQQASQELAGFQGLTARFLAGPSGDVSELRFGSGDRQPQRSSELVGALQQFVELVLVPFPSEPLGVGAKWERDESTIEGGMPQKGRRVFELRDGGAEGLTVSSVVETTVAKRPYADPRMPRGTTMQADSRGTGLYKLRLDRVASSFVGEQRQVVTIEVGGQAGAGEPAGEKRVVKQEIKTKHVMETAK